MRLTGPGKACALLVAALWAAAFTLHSPWAALAGALVSCYLLVHLATLDVPPLEISRKFERAQVVEAEPVVETLRVKHLGLRRQRITLREAQPPGMSCDEGAQIHVALQPRGATEHAIRWRANTWGVKRFQALRVVASDPMRFLEVEGVLQGEEEVRVLPRAAALDKYAPRASNPEPALGAHNVSKPGDGSEFFALREYQSGDSIRRINWKASARTPKTMVNQVTRDTFARIVVFLDMREKEGVGPHERSPYVRNVRAVAQILASHDKLRDQVILVRVDEKASRLSLSANPRMIEQLETLAGCEPKGAMPLHAAVRECLPILHARSPVYVVTSAALDPDLGEALGLVRAARAWPVLVSPSVPDLDEGVAAFRKTRELALAEARASGARVHDWTEDQALAVMLRAS